MGWQKKQTLTIYYDSKDGIQKKTCNTSIKNGVYKENINVNEVTEICNDLFEITAIIILKNSLLCKMLDSW